MKYGRQRWKLRGRIEINGKQVWDSEETVFLPLINEFLSVKVGDWRLMLQLWVAVVLAALLLQYIHLDLNDQS